MLANLAQMKWGGGCVLGGLSFTTAVHGVRPGGIMSGGVMSRHRAPQLSVRPYF